MLPARAGVFPTDRGGAAVPAVGGVIRSWPLTAFTSSRGNAAACDHALAAVPLVEPGLVRERVGGSLTSSFAVREGQVAH